MIKIRLIAALCCLVQVFAFAPTKSVFIRSTAIFGASSTNDPNLENVVLSKNNNINNSFLASSLGGVVTGLCTSIAAGVASDDYEIAELPSPLIPIVFAIVLLGGVGFLTASLGDVMDEGKKLVKVACLLAWLLLVLLSAKYLYSFADIFFSITEALLGMQSGSRAKKEIDRSRSSYFKKGK